MQKLVGLLFTLLFVLVPLVFYPYSSEVFEFNKMVTVYVFTVLIVSAWTIRMISEKRFIFKSTLLDIPLILFLLSEFISTIISIDRYTSIFGYYSRFHGGLLSTICYLLLYWGFVSNIDRQQVSKILKYFLYSLIFVSIYGIFEHFGKSPSCLLIRGEWNVDCWVQDVQNRVFATMGQPNWLAALLVAALPLTWYQMLSTKENKIKILWFSSSLVFFFALLATKSRSGLGAFVIASFIFWLGSFTWSIVNKNHMSKIVKFGFSLNILFLILVGSIGTPWTPTILAYLNKKDKQETKQEIPQGPVLEVGGTESGEIRKIVWSGAIDLVKKYPVFGTGVETFGFSYYETRPQSHNLTSEWDFLYNKAHNEYLNFAATTGLIGLFAYLIVIIASIIQMTTLFFKAKENKLLVLSLITGFVSILVTNFFGFSVVAVGLCFFLFPAIAVCINKKAEKSEVAFDLEDSQKIYLGIILVVALILLYLLGNYWLADYNYSSSKINQQTGEYKEAMNQAETAVKMLPNQAIYHDQLARLYSTFAVAFYEEKQATYAGQLAQLAQMESDKSFGLSPRNVNIQRSRSAIFLDLTAINSNYLYRAVDINDYILNFSPTDAKAFYKAATIYNRAGLTQKALDTFERCVELKPNYTDARIAYGLLLLENKQQKKAKEQFEYVIKYLDPNNKLAMEKLQSLK